MDGKEESTITTEEGEEKPALKVEKDEEESAPSASLVDSKELQQRRKKPPPLDLSRVQQALASLQADRDAESELLEFQKIELAIMRVKQEDVDIMVNELELDREVAEKSLREHKGDVVAAIMHHMK